MNTSFKFYFKHGVLLLSHQLGHFKLFELITILFELGFPQQC